MNEYYDRCPLCTDKIIGIQIFGRCSGCVEQFLEMKFSVECVQPWNPRRPETIVARNLQKLVAENLGIDDPTMIEIFTLMGTPFYRTTGVSAKIRFDGVEVNVRAVINPFKCCRGNVDVLMDGENDSLQKTAREIVEILKHRQKRKNSTRRKYAIR